MTNDELKKKILTIVRGAMLEADELPFIETTDNIADALIAAGIGDVETVQKIAASATAMSVLVAATAEHRAEVAELVVKNLNDIFTFDYQTVFEQAEKELEEEGEDDNN